MSSLGFSPSLYGLILGLGIFISFWVVSRVAEKEKFSTDLIWDSLPWVVFPGIIGARLYHVVDQWQYYQQNLLEILMVWQGGVGIFGALIGGVLGICLYLHYGNQPQKVTGTFKRKLIIFLDLGVLGVPLAQAIGRWGNYVNHELYGLPSTLPWAITIPPEFRFPQYNDVTTYHPLFLYESFLSLVLWIVLYMVWKRRVITLGTGKLLGIYLIGYGVIRSVLEPLRIERWEIGSVPTAWIVSSILIITGVILVWRKAHD